MATLMKQCMETFYGSMATAERMAAMRQEWPKLTDKDKADLTAWFEAEGVKIDAPSATK